MTNETGGLWAKVFSQDDDVMLRNLSAAHAEMFGRSGLSGDTPDTALPTDASVFALQQARLAVEIAREADPSKRSHSLATREMQRHRQLGLLAINVANYSSVLGNFGDVEQFREFGRHRLEAAQDMRLTIIQTTQQNDPFEALIDDELRAKAAADWAAKDMDGKNGGKDGNGLD